MHSRMRGRSSSYALVLLAALILFAHAASVYADNPSQGANNAPADAQKSKESTKSSKDTVTSGSDGKSESKSEGCTASAIKEAQARDDGEFLQKCGSTKGKVTAKDKDGKVTFECIKGEDCDAKLREMQEVMKSGGSVTYQPPGSNDGVQLRTQPNPQRTDQFNAILDSYDPKNQARNAEIAAQNRADDNAFANGGKGFLDSDGFANLLEKEAVKNFPKTNYPIVEGTLSDWGSLRSRLDNVALSDTTWDMANSFGNLSRFVEGQGGFINLGGGSTFSFQNGVPTFNLSPSDIRPFSQSGAFGATAALGSSNPFLQNPYASLQPPQSPTFQSLAGLQQAAPQGTTVGEIVAIRPDGTQQTLVWNPFTGRFEPLVDASQLPPAIDPKLISFTSVSDVTAAQIEQAFAELDSGQKTFQELADVAAFPIAPSEPTSVPGTVLTNLTPEERAAVLPTFGQAVSAWSEGKIDNVEFARQIGQNLAQSSRAIFQRFGFAQVLPEGNVVDPPLAENGVPVIPVERSPIAPAVARLPGGAPASSVGAGASGRAGTDRPILYDIASYNWDKFTDVFQDPTKAARLAFGFDGKEPVPGDETVAVTYPHWGNEGGQSSGVVTNEILSRLPKGTEISIPHTAPFAEAQRILDNCKGCVVKFYMESNPNERNDAGYGMSIPARIEQAAQLAQRLEQAGYGERVVRTIEPDAARDYFDAGRSAVAVEHAKLIKAAGFEYEAKSLSAAQIEQLQREAGVTVRTAVFEDPKNPAYARSLEESIASGRPTTVILKGVPTPGYPNPDTRGEALALAERHKDAGNLTVVYTPAGGVPELVRIADESVPRGLLDRGIMKEGVSFDRAQTSAQAAERARYFLESGGLLWDSARKTVEAGYESLSEATDGVRETFGFGDRTSGGNQVTLMDTPLGRDVEVDTRGGVQASSRYVDAATAQLQDQVQRSVESGALPSGTEIVSREEALRRAAELPNENKSLTSFGSTGKTTGQLAADTINATNAERFIATPDGKFYAVGQETAKIELPTKEGIQAVADRMKEVFACSNRSCLGMVSYAGNGAALPEDVKSIMQNKFGFGGATNPNGNIAKVTIAAFAGACEMDPADCQGVYINSAQRNRSGLGSDRHTSEYARAFDLQGFRDNNQKVRFLTRMAAIGEAMGRDLKANVGQGGNVTHIDFNGSEISRGGGWVWEYPGGQSSAQAALHSAVASGRLSDSFITNTLGANLSAAAPRATLQPVVGGGEAVALPASSAKGYAEVIALVYGPPTPESMGTAVQGAVPIGRYDPTEPATAVTRFDPNTGRIYTVPIPPAERAPVVPRAPWSPDGGYRGPGGGVTPSPFEQIAQSLGNMFGGGQGGGGQGGGQGGATSGGAPAAGAPSAPRAAPPAVAAATPAILKFSCEPNAFLKEGITTVTWACGNNGTSKGTGFDTRGLPSGSVQVPLATTTTFNLACYAQGALVAERQCTVALLKPKVVIVAIPSSVEKGGTVRIGWITSQTKNCSFYGPGTVLQGGGPHGTMEVKNLEASTRFKLACGTTAGVFETPLIVEVKGYSGPIVDAEVSAEGVPAAPPAKSVEQRESAAVTNESAEPLNQSGGSAAPPNGSQEGKFTATDASGNAISLCDPSVGLFKFTQCLLGN